MLTLQPLLGGFQAEPEAEGKLAGKTFTIPLEESKARRIRDSPSPSKDTSDKKKKKDKKHKKHKKHKAKGKDRHADQAGAGLAQDDDNDDSSDVDMPDRANDNAVNNSLVQDPDIVDQGKAGPVARHSNVAVLAGGRRHGNYSLHDASDLPLPDSKVGPVVGQESALSKPTTKASGTSDAVQPATGTDSSVKKSRGMAMGAVLRRGTLPGVKPKRK